MSNIRSLSDVKKEGSGRGRGGGPMPGGGGQMGGGPMPGGGGQPAMPGGLGGLGGLLGSFFGGGAPQAGGAGEDHKKVIFLHQDGALAGELRKAGGKLVRCVTLLKCDP